VSSSVVVNVRLPSEIFEATKAKAKREERTASAVIRRALKLDIERDQQSEGRTV
jgi:predicted transcriptional regulator